MLRSLACAALLAAALATPAAAGAGDYAFESVAPEYRKGDDVTVALRLVHKPTGKPVSDAVVIRTRLDMAPDDMAAMESPLTPLPAGEPGVYAFKTDLSMAGRYLFSIAAKVQGEPETVVGKVVFRAVK
ncbi:MAG: heavy metal RND transporter [Bradyrhizobiaceae bacterium]|nr:MAG: heavy metal RND transporter [Bradyrhizobiaceae bacterium]